MLMRECVLSGWNKEHENEALFFLWAVISLVARSFFSHHHFDYVINEKRPKDSINSY